MPSHPQYFLPYLKSEISNTYLKIFEKRIESIVDPNTEAVSSIKYEIKLLMLLERSMNCTTIF
jgi:hypothetical protein